MFTYDDTETKSTLQRTPQGPFAASSKPLAPPLTTGTLSPAYPESTAAKTPPPRPFQSLVDAFKNGASQALTPKGGNDTYSNRSNGTRATTAS